MAVFERHAAPDQAEHQVEVPPVVGLDDGAERDVADEDDIGAEHEGLPGTVAEKDAEAGGNRPADHDRP